MRIQNLNYKREYYKKIIEKRIEAQEAILALIYELRIQVKLDSGVMCNRICADDYEFFNNFVVSLAMSVRSPFWLSDKLNGTMLKFNIFLLNEIESIVNKLEPQEQKEALEQLGTAHLEKLREFRTQIENQLKSDFANMSNVKSFIRSKREDEPQLYWLKK
ncbi:MAG: hypothetical protein ABJP45_07305 [Cyclobacteriaceae bacterium]